MIPPTVRYLISTAIFISMMWYHYKVFDRPEEIIYWLIAGVVYGVLTFFIIRIIEKSKDIRNGIAISFFAIIALFVASVVLNFQTPRVYGLSLISGSLACWFAVSANVLVQVRKFQLIGPIVMLLVAWYLHFLAFVTSFA